MHWMGRDEQHLTRLILRTKKDDFFILKQRVLR